MGVPILRRDGRRVVPTEAGLTLYRYASEMLAATNALKRDVDAIASGELDEITVGANPAYSAHVLPELLVRFQPRHPGTRLTLVQGSMVDIAAQVRSGQIDAGVVHSSFPQADHDGIYLGHDEVLIVESARHPITNGQPMTLEEVSKAPLVDLRAGRVQPAAPLNNLLVAAGLPPAKAVLILSTWDGVKQGVRAGIGLAVVLHALVRGELRSGEFRVVAVHGFRELRHVYLLSSDRRRERPSGAFRDLHAFLEQEVPAAFYRSPGLIPTD